MTSQRLTSAIIAAIILMVLLSACGARVAAPVSTNLWSEDPLVLSLPPVDPEAYLHLFRYDVSMPLGIQENRMWTTNGATWIDLSYNSPKGGTVPATLVIPDGKGPFAGIVMMHGGAYGSKRQDEFWRATGYAELGAVTLLIDAPFARPEAQAEKRRLGPLTWSARDQEEQIQLIVDLQRAVDLLASRPDVDTDRMAYVGNSFGGAVGGLFAGVETRLKAYALSVGDGGWVTHYTGPEDAHSYPAGPYFSVSEVGQERWLAAMWPIEPIHYVGLATPAALLFQNGARDINVPPRDALRFQAAGSEPKTIFWYDSPHALPGQAYQDQALWLQQQIGTGTVLGSLVLVPSFRESGKLVSRLILVWLILVLGSAGTVGWYVIKKRGYKINLARKLREFVCLIPVIVLGPFGFLACRVLHQNQVDRSITGKYGASVWRNAAASVAWTVTFTMVSVMGVVVLMLSRADSQTDAVTQMVINFALTFLANVVLWLMLWRVGSVRKPFLGALISMNAALVGINFVIIVLEYRWFPFGLSLTAAGAWIAFQLAAVTGAVTAYPFHLWFAARGFIRCPDQVPSEIYRNPHWIEVISVFLVSFIALIIAIGAALVIISGLPAG